MLSRTALGKTAGLRGDVEPSVQACQIRHSLGPHQYGRERLDLHLPRHFVHLPVARQRDENRAIVGAVRRAEDPDDRQRILGHLLSLVEPVPDPQARSARDVGAQHGLVRRLLGRIVAEEPSLGYREGFPAPREGREVPAGRRHVAVALERVSHRDGHGDLDTGVVL